ncbi:hypothetical protein [Pseudoalteromonas tunicata]|jgi:outer membrane receptor for ferrienterochelin and colicin|uniref:TonB-dependent receptor n=1 Tax=Pseudoalteromonas tunicata D2 TaxID=87626 RepID=A4CEI2_9GAMM|nr:hypothetical protein [Pseudoalteromonas tunicata]ATC92969.1 hypothetical protein PTUN_a0134 [Pseudoalteromonas tunicata]EAR26994.1 hypothetical protein PTD2_10448 [Pseudoalteromonas tunicata D2]
MFNFKQSALHLAVGSILLSCLVFNVNAAEEGIEAVERIEVTGSRIKRSDLEAAPVTVITADDMKL